MKYIDTPQFREINCHLNEIENFDVKLEAKLEAWSCKPVGQDKKLSRSLDETYKKFATSPNLKLSTTQIGSLADPQTRKTIIYMVNLLNSSFSDFDFSGIDLNEFKSDTAAATINNIDIILSGVIENYLVKWKKTLWQAIDQEIKVDESKVFSFVCDPDGDPFGENTLWSFFYFFYNKKLKRIVFFACRAKSKGVLGTDNSDDSMSASDSENSSYNSEYEGYNMDLDLDL